ncbi:MAG TPA: hypothetical protein VF740_02845, partial [Candidatus Acidoferrum sp.]
EGAISMHKSVSIFGILLLFTAPALAQDLASIHQKAFSCAEATGILCAEVYQPVGGELLNFAAIGVSHKPPQCFCIDNN